MTTAISSRRFGRRDPSVEDSSLNNRKKKNSRSLRASKPKAKLRWLPACPPPGRDVIAAPMAIQRTGSRSPSLRLPLHLENQLFQGRPAEPEFFTLCTRERSLRRALWFINACGPILFLDRHRAHPVRTVFVTHVKWRASKHQERRDGICGVCRTQVFEPRDLQEKWRWREDAGVVCCGSGGEARFERGEALHLHDRRLWKSETRTK